MQRSKEEVVNGIANKETLVTPPKMSKPPVERPHERKVINTNTNTSQESPITKLPVATPEPNNNMEQKQSKLKPLTDSKNIRVVKNIGFENLPDQMYRRSMFNGFEFNLMVVGCSGLGKSTFVNTLFLAELYNNENLPPSKRTQKTTQVNTTTVCLTENSVQLKLTLIDTPGFGESLDNSDCWNPVLQYIESKYNDFMNGQNRVNRQRVVDNRVHACLYFIEPTGHGLKPLDVEFMKRIHTKVNIIPVIGKADTLIPEECTEFKKTILKQIKTNGIRIYDFPEEAAAISLGVSMAKSRETPNWKDISAKRKRQPFAIVCSNALVDKAGVKVRGRAYPWGVVEVDSLEHNDFSALRSLLLSSHLQDLKDTTDQVLFENFRCDQMADYARQGQFGVTADGKDPMSQMDVERREFEAKIRKMEDDMRVLFEQKVAEKTRKLDEFQSNIERSERDMQAQLEAEVRDIEKRRAHFESQRLQWEELNRDSNFRASMDTLDIKDKNKTRGKWLLK